MSAPSVFDPLAGQLRRLARGDRAAAATVVAALGPRAHRIAWRLLRNDADAEEVAQEALIRLWKAAPDWVAGRARVETWLHTVVTNLCFDRLRKAGRFIDGAEAPEPADETALADMVLVAGDTRARVDAALAALPDRQRAAIVLTHFEDLPAVEAGAVLGVSVEALESLLARGRRALRAALVAEKSELLASLGAGGAR